jgi:lipoate-protein ligase A
MELLDLTLPTAEENLACDEALLLEAEAGRQGELLRLWEWSAPLVVLGAGCRLADDVDEGACIEDGVPLLRRSSGGGTVLLGKGCLCFSLVLSYKIAPELREIGSSYAYVVHRIAKVLDGLLPNITLAGTSDLTSQGRKFSGNAQQRKRRFLLHHGTLLYRFDISQAGRYLRMPARQPEYRGHRENDTFLTNLPTDSSELRRRLMNAWAATEATASYPDAEIQRLVREKYSQKAWIRRR